MKEAEKARLSKEQQEREQRRKDEQEEVDRKRDVNDRLEMFKKSEIGQKILKDIDVEVSWSEKDPQTPPPPGV